MDDEQQSVSRHHFALAALRLGLVYAGVPALLYRNGFVIYANPLADELLRNNAILFAQDGVLRTRRQHESEAMAAILAEMDASTGSRSLVLSNRQSQPIMLLTFEPLAAPDAEPLVLLRISDLHARPMLDPACLADLFGLSRGEARVVAALFAGQSVNAAAAALRVAPETVRGQLKRAMGKLGVNSQVQLMGLLHNSLTAASVLRKI